jgi:Tfp pilus assembly protein PilF
VDFFGIFGTSQSPTVQAAEAHYLIGLGQLGKGNRAAARQELQQAVQGNPTHLGARSFLNSLNDGE